jgi:DNA-3-methyladenine glycosylase
VTPRAGAAARPRASLRRHAPGAPLPPSFYDRPTELVARELLGAVLVHHAPEGTTAGRIVETEAYLGDDDPACHAVVGRTQRTWWLFGPPGVAYVYRIYGAHWCFNAVTREEGHGSAVLVRALEPLEGIALMRARRARGGVAPRRDTALASGPGKLCDALGITRALDGHPLAEPPLAILAGDAVPDERVAVGPRIGITRAADWPLRWVVQDSPHLSRRVRSAG